MLIEGIAGRFIQNLRGQYAGRLTDFGSVAVDQIKESGDEATRAGIRYHLLSNGVTGVAAVTTLPSVAASWILYNPQGNNVTAFLDRIAASNNSGAAGATGGSVWVCPCPARFIPSTIPTISAANTIIQNANITSGKSSNLILASSVTLLNAATGNWIPVATFGGYSATAALLNGCVLDSGWDIRGKISIPPGTGLALCVVDAAGTFTPYFSWREYASDME